MSRDWTRKVLDSRGQQWHLMRNALMLLGHVSQAEEDSARAAKFMRHTHPRVRDEALKLVIQFKPEVPKTWLLTPWMMSMIKCDGVQ